MKRPGEPLPPLKVSVKSLPFTSGAETGVTPSEARIWALTVPAGDTPLMPAGMWSVIVAFQASLPPVFWTLSVYLTCESMFTVEAEPVLVSVRFGSTTVIGGVVPGQAWRSTMLVVLIGLLNHILAVLENCAPARFTFTGLLSRTTVTSISRLYPAGSEASAGLYS